MTEQEEKNELQDTILSPKQALTYLGNLVALSTLSKWRPRGTGPKWFRCGDRKVAYRKSDLDQWISDQTVDPHQVLERIVEHELSNPSNTIKQSSYGREESIRDGKGRYVSGGRSRAVDMDETPEVLWLLSLPKDDRWEMEKAAMRFQRETRKAPDLNQLKQWYQAFITRNSRVTSVT